MTIREFHLQTVLATLENANCLGRLLFFPEVSAYGREPEEVRAELARLADKVLRDLPLVDLHRRCAAGELEVREVTVEVRPPDVTFWTTPLPLRFHVVCWNHGRDASIAYVPALDIEIVAGRPEELEPRIADEIRFALMRRKATGSLRPLLGLQRTEEVAVEPVTHAVEIKTPKQIAQHSHAASQKSVLQEVATNLTKARLPEVFGLDDVVLRLADWLAGRTPRSVLLVGPSGVGKTAAVYKLAAERLLKKGTGTATQGEGSDGPTPEVAEPVPVSGSPLWSTSGARLVAGMCGFGMWQERCQELCREAAKTKAIVHLGNLMELVQVGTSVSNDQGVGDFLRPAIARGELVAIAECTPEELALIERISPSLLDAFVRLEVKEPSSEASLAILRQAVRAHGRSGSARLDEAAITTLDRLHRRYATYSAYPGRPLRFLKNLLDDAPRAQVLTAADVTAAFSRETGLPRHLLEETVPLDLAATREWLQRRVIGQAQAVDVVVDLLATVKAELARPDRPLASLMFIGPTGVGKTEMAKALAEFLYQDRQRMTRIDMSEYADPSAIDRLIGTSGRGEGLLTAKVREQPFGVVLLDEFEKAHPSFYDLLLQVLGEGRLTDGAGRLADFRNSVIIMTSNLGAESFGRPVPGFHAGAEPGERAGEHFVRHVQDFVRPEMFNRIDRIVTFLPLGEATLREIARRELELLRGRDGLRYRPLQVEFSEPLAETLAGWGYDPRYGARPLKRAVERHLLVPLATALNECAAYAPLRAEIVPRPQGLRVAVRSSVRDERAVGEPGPLSDASPLAPTAAQCMTLRREAVRVQQSPAMLDVRNELYRLQRIQQRRAIRKQTVVTPEDQSQDRRRAVLEALTQRTDGIVAEATALEEQVLCGCYLAQAVSVAKTTADLETQSAALLQLSFDLYAMQFERPDFVTLAVYGEHAEWRGELAQAYFELATARRCDVQAYALLSYGDSRPATRSDIRLGDRDSKDEKQRRQANDTRLLARRLSDPGAYLADANQEAIGVGFCIHGPQAWLLLQAEEGLHVFQQGNKKLRCLVHVSGEAMPQYQPPYRIDRREGIGSQELRRLYDRARQQIDDRSLHRREHWSGEALGRTIARLAEEQLQSRVKEWL